MANYVEYIKVGSGESWPVRDPDAQEKLANIVDIVYPTGSIYMSINSTSPATLFGGTWEQIKDVFLLSAGDKHLGGSTGGEEEHTLNISEMPSHKHVGLTWAGRSDMPISFGTDGEIVEEGYGLEWSHPLAYNTDIHTNETGSDQPHNNMPPYLTVYVWKRVG